MRQHHHTHTDGDLFAAYPLPWTSIADPVCARIVAANGATVLACTAHEAPIVRHISTAMNQQYARQTLTPVIGELSRVLATLDGYPTPDDFVDDLIVAAESVIQALDAPPAA